MFTNDEKITSAQKTEEVKEIEAVENQAKAEVSAEITKDVKEGVVASQVKKEIKFEAPASFGQNNNNRDGARKFGPNSGPRKYNQSPEDKIYDERVITIRRVTKVVKGGRRFRFSAVVVVGDKKGRVGFGIGKANEVPSAIKKAIKDARKNLIHVKGIVNGTISHEFVGKNNSSEVLLKPAPQGTGVIASDTVRAVVELAGISNIYSKSLGSNNKINAILATLDALKHIRTKEHYENLRGVKI